MNDTIPIGILTRNRAVYLAETLRSLRASDIRNIPLIIYDDASDDPVSRRFLDTSDVIDVEHSWPRFSEWNDAGLGYLKDNDPIQGIGGEMDVLRIDADKIGVTDASCQAIWDLFDNYPGAPGVVLLQDDIVVTKTWYHDLISRHRPGLGIVAGMHLDQRRPMADFYTAQCYLITQEFFEAKRSWFERRHPHPMGFDKQICYQADHAGLDVELIRPYICQHIGVVSEVRPFREFKTEEYTRLGSDRIRIV